MIFKPYFELIQNKSVKYSSTCANRCPSVKIMARADCIFYIITIRITTKRIFIVVIDHILTIVMSDSASLVLNFKTGVLKELHKRNLINSDELAKAIKICKEQ